MRGPERLQLPARGRPVDVRGGAVHLRGMQRQERGRGVHHAGRRQRGVLRGSLRPIARTERGRREPGELQRVRARLPCRIDMLHKRQRPVLPGLPDGPMPGRLRLRAVAHVAGDDAVVLPARKLRRPARRSPLLRSRVHAQHHDPRRHLLRGGVRQCKQRQRQLRWLWCEVLRWNAVRPYGGRGDTGRLPMKRAVRTAASAVGPRRAYQRRMAYRAGAWAARRKNGIRPARCFLTGRATCPS